MRLTRRCLPLLAAPAMTLGMTLGMSPGMAPAWAQTAWPDRAVTLVVPWPAGGSTDALVRAITQHLGVATGQSFIVDNRAGATGTVGHVLKDCISILPIAICDRYSVPNEPF